MVLLMHALQGLFGKVSRLSYEDKVIFVGQGRGRLDEAKV